MFHCGAKFLQELNFADNRFFCVCFARTYFAIGKDCFFLLGINFCDLEEVDRVQLVTSCLHLAFVWLIALSMDQQ